MWISWEKLGELAQLDKLRLIFLYVKHIKNSLVKSSKKCYTYTIKEGESPKEGRLSMNYNVYLSNGVILSFYPSTTKGYRRRMVKLELDYWRSCGQLVGVEKYRRMKAS